MTWYKSRYWHTLGNGCLFFQILIIIQWSEFIFWHKCNPLLTSYLSPPTLLRKSLPQIARCLPEGACQKLWPMTVLWLCLPICHPTFLLVPLFWRFVGTCSDCCLTMYLRAFIIITKSDMLSGERGSENRGEVRGPLKFSHKDVYVQRYKPKTHCIFLPYKWCKVIFFKPFETYIVYIHGKMLAVFLPLFAGPLLHL